MWLAIAVVACAVFPVTLLRKLHAFRFTSFLAIGVVCVLIILFTVRFIEPLETDRADIEVDFFVWDLTLFQSMSLFSLSFLCHFNTLAVHGELQKPTKQRVTGVIWLANGLSFFIYFIVGFIGYLTFGAKTSGDILNDYDPQDVLIFVGKIGFTITLCLTYPLLCHPTRATIELLFFRNFKPSNVRSFIEALCIVAASVAGAMFIPDILDVWSLYGSIIATSYVYILPPAIHLRIKHMTGSATRMTYVVNAILMLVGLFLMVACTFESIDTILNK